MTSPFHRVPLAPFALVLVSACGASSPPPASEPEAAHVEPTPPERPWAELSHDERRAHMARHVMPVMSELFTSYDAERFADVSCATCHGEGAAERGFAMPNPDLLPLYPTGSLGQYAMVERYPEGARFMFSRVLPAMQTLLGAEAYDAEAHTGFSCYACHPHAPDDDPMTAPAPSSSDHEAHTAIEGPTRF